MEFLAFKLLLTLAFLIGFPVLMVMLPIMVICEVAKTNQKKRQQEASDTSVSPRERDRGQER